MGKKQIAVIIEKYIKSLEDNGIRVDKVILYGSYAVGKANKDSDIDVVVVSPDFGKDYLAEGMRLKLATIGVDTRISPRAFSVDAVNAAEPGDLLYDEVLKKGIVFKNERK